MKRTWTIDRVYIAKRDLPSYHGFYALGQFEWGDDLHAFYNVMAAFKNHALYSIIERGGA